MTATATYLLDDASSQAESIFFSVTDDVYDEWRSHNDPPGQLPGRWGYGQDAKDILIFFVKKVLPKALQLQNPAWECDLDFDRDHIPDGLLLANRFAAKRVEIKLNERSIKIGGECLPLDLSASGDLIVKEIVEQVARFFGKAPSKDQNPFRLPRPSTRVGRF
jgi:hypothetical protein